MQSIIIPTVATFQILRSSGDLDRLLTAGHRIVVVDAAADEAGILSFESPNIIVAPTDIWNAERTRREAGATPQKNAGELAAVDFLTSEDGLRHYVEAGKPVVLVLDSGWWVSPKRPANIAVVAPEVLVEAVGV
jgi:hypothetical protein